MLQNAKHVRCNLDIIVYITQFELKLDHRSDASICFANDNKLAILCNQLCIYVRCVSRATLHWLFV